MSTPANALVEKIRGKFPGVYDDISDTDLTQKILAKHPEYGDLATAPSSASLTAQTNAAASAGGAPRPGVSPTPLPGAGQKILGGTFPSPLDASGMTKAGLAPNAQPIASVPLPISAGYLSAPRMIGSVAGSAFSSKLAQKVSDNPWVSDLAGTVGGAFGAGTGAAAEDVPGVWNSLKLKIPDEVKIPWTGIKVSRNQFPSSGYSTPIGPDAGEFYQNKADDLVSRGNAQDAIDRRATIQQNKLQRAAQSAKDARDQAFNDRAQSMQMQQAYQDKLDAAKLKADNALARSQRAAQMQQGTDMSAEIEYNKNLSQQATEAAEENRQRNLQASQAEDQRVQDLHDQFAKSLSDLEAHRQKTLGDFGKLNNQWGDAVNRRGDASAAISPNAPNTSQPGDLRGNPTPFTPSLDGQDLISRTRKITIPGDEPTAMDLKRAGDLTQAPVERLKTLAKFGDKLAQNELNRRLKN